MAGKRGRSGRKKGSGARPDDPPTFESEATYLDRHGVLTPAERRRLPAGAFDPDVLEIDADDPRPEYPAVFAGPTFDDEGDDDDDA